VLVSGLTATANGSAPTFMVAITGWLLVRLLITDTVSMLAT
jgi:hypothetical protein